MADTAAGVNFPVPILDAVRWVHALACAAACVIANVALAQNYPTRPLRLIVAFAPGGSVDVIARIVAQKLGDALGQQVVVDNRPGAGGNVSAEIAARSVPDGHTLYVCSASLVANASLYRKIPYDPIRDFAPVTLLASAQSVLVVHPAFAAKTVNDIIALAKKAPGKINYASPGSGSSGHLTMELFKAMAGVDLVHVPYKIMSQLQGDVIAGQIPVAFSTIPGALPHIQAARMVAVAVSGARRSPALPNVPTIAEAGVPGYEATTWYPVLVPAHTPTAIVGKLNAALVAIVKAPELQERLLAMGVEPIGSTSDDLAAHMKRELKKWAKVVEASGALSPEYSHPRLRGLRRRALFIPR
jgi:tripartite-type tricarboxylate transporter receptor subunit TctC